PVRPGRATTNPMQSLKSTGQLASTRWQRSRSESAARIIQDRPNHVATLRASRPQYRDNPLFRHDVRPHEFTPGSRFPRKAAAAQSIPLQQFGGAHAIAPENPDLRGAWSFTRAVVSQETKHVRSVV